MAKSADIRPGITLACTECKERNYITTRTVVIRHVLSSEVLPALRQADRAPRDSLIASITALQNPAHSAGFLRIDSRAE